jgi:endonuclease YncB( thermonuclease family)
MGHIEIKGNINIHQFWPVGRSDADTTKINLKLNEDSFLFFPGGSAKPVKTKVFLNGKVKPASGQSVNPVKYAGTARQYITLRLEGIDAPELHYRFYDPATLAKYNGISKFKKYNIDYRQYFSEISTRALSDMLNIYANPDGLVPAVFYSNNINKPGDVCDIYGRFVGYILINNKKINVNEWLLSHGLVFPAFYDSALESEIDSLINIYHQAKKKQNTMLAYYSDKNLSFDFKLLFRPNGKPDPSKDMGKLILPKLFRRFCCYSILHKSEITSESFDDYLKSKKDDKLIMTSKFRSFIQSHKKSTFEGLIRISDIYKNVKLTVDPEQIVFIEGGSDLIDPVSKKKIERF